MPGNDMFNLLTEVLWMDRFQVIKIIKRSQIRRQLKCRIRTIDRRRIAGQRTSQPQREMVQLPNAFAGILAILWGFS